MTRRYDLVVLGGGSAGLTAAIGAAGVGARVLLAEASRTGGECLWTGCVPSKSLLAAADLAHRMRTADTLGLPPSDPDVDLGAVMAHVRGAQQRLAEHDSPRRLEGLGVEVVHGTARFVAPGVVAVDGREVPYRTALVATGSRPVLPPVDGLDEVGALTTDTIWDVEELPERLVVLGGGPTGCELGQAYARLGSRVTLVEMLPHLLDRETSRVRALIRDRLRAEGVDVRLSTRAVAVRRDGSAGRLTVENGGGEEVIEFDRLLVSTGRRAATDDLGLERVGVATSEDGSVRTDRYLRTTNRRIFAAGDVTGGPPFTHVASYEAGLVVTNALFHLRRSASYDAIPWVTFTDPEIGRVGLTEDQARARHNDGISVARFEYAALDRAVCAGQAYGFIELVADPRGRVVGATVAAPNGGEVVAELAVWVREGGTLTDVSQTVHAYPSFALGAKRAADEHLREVWLSDRVRRFTRPLLTLLRWVERPR